LLASVSHIPCAAFTYRLLTDEDFFDRHVLGFDPVSISEKRSAPLQRPPYTSVPYFNQTRQFPGMFCSALSACQAVGVFTVEKPYEGDGPIPLRVIFWPKWLNDCLPKPLRIGLISHLEVCFFLAQLTGEPWFSFISDLKNWFYQLPLPDFIRKYMGVFTSQGAFLGHLLAVLSMGWKWSPSIAQVLTWSLLLTGLHDRSDRAALGIDEDEWTTITSPPPDGHLPVVPKFLSLRRKGALIGFISVIYDNVGVVCTDRNVRNRWHARWIAMTDMFNARRKYLIPESVGAGPAEDSIDFGGVHYERVPARSGNPSSLCWTHTDAKWARWAELLPEPIVSNRDFVSRMGIVSHHLAIFDAWSTSPSLLLLLEAQAHLLRSLLVRNGLDDPVTPTGFWNGPVAASLPPHLSGAVVALSLECSSLAALASDPTSANRRRFRSPHQVGSSFPIAVDASSRAGGVCFIRPHWASRFWICDHFLGHPSWPFDPVVPLDVMGVDPAEHISIFEAAIFQTGSFRVHDWLRVDSRERLHVDRPDSLFVILSDNLAVARAMAKGWSPIARIHHFVVTFRVRFGLRQYIVVQVRGDDWNVSDSPSRLNTALSARGIAHCLERAEEGRRAFILTGARFLPLPFMPTSPPGSE
jgi:hypothetical protein